MEPRFTPNTVTKDLFRDYTISFPGGSLTATKDVMLSLFEKDNLPSTCDPEEVDISRKSYARTSYPEGPTTVVAATTYKLKNYSNGGSGRSAAGEPIKILINNDFWTARLIGSHQAFMDYLCDNKSSLRDGFTYWISEKGSPYLMTDNT